MARNKEGPFQTALIKDIEALLPGSIVLKNDSSYRPGIPDLTVFFEDRWATLEVKKDKDADQQPNQDYYVELMNGMSYSSFVYPENKDEVLRGLQRALQPKRRTRVSRSK